LTVLSLLNKGIVSSDITAKEWIHQQKTSIPRLEEQIDHESIDPTRSHTPVSSFPRSFPNVTFHPSLHTPCPAGRPHASSQCTPPYPKSVAAMNTSSPLVSRITYPNSVSTNTISSITHLTLKTHPHPHAPTHNAAQATKRSAPPSCTPGSRPSIRPRT
jgi:hypothetical protein